MNVLEALRDVSPIPREKRLWSIATIAAYVELEPSYVAQEIVCQPDFPKAIRWKDGAKPRWIAGEVISWFESRKE